MLMWQNTSQNRCVISSFKLDQNIKPSYSKFPHKNFHYYSEIKKAINHNVVKSNVYKLPFNTV